MYRIPVCSRFTSPVKRSPFFMMTTSPRKVLAACREPQMASSTTMSFSSREQVPGIRARSVIGFLQSEIVEEASTKNLAPAAGRILAMILGSRELNSPGTGQTDPWRPYDFGAGAGAGGGGG